MLICLVIKKSKPIVAEVFIRGRKLNIALAFITQFSFAVPQKITRISPRYFIIKVSNKEEPKQILFNDSSDIEFKGAINLYAKCTVKA